MFVRRLAPALVIGLACRPAAGPAAPVPVCGPHPCTWDRLVAAVDSGVRAGAAPGAVVAVSIGGARFIHPTGQLGVGQPAPVTDRTVYDLASLTKVVALATLTMMAVDEGVLGLDDPVSKYLPGWQGPGKDRVTVRHLLTHSSGLPPHRPLWREAPDRDSALALVVATALDTLPGTRTAYSDLGAITLTRIVEQRLGGAIDQLFHDRIASPLGLRSTRYLPPTSWREWIAPTEQDPWRRRLIWGEVHDENAAFLGGVSGHAGLFSNAADLLIFGEWLLRRRQDVLPQSGEPRLSAAVVRQFTHRQDLVPGSSRALGWDTPATGSSAGSRLSADSFGHTGFTGTSIWLDPSRGLVVVLLSNRVNPTRDNSRLGPLRALVADLAVEVTDAPAR